MSGYNPSYLFRIQVASGAIVDMVFTAPSFAAARDMAQVYGKIVSSQAID